MLCEWVDGMSEVSWSIEELVVRYTLEPSLQDVFVEGKFDKDVFLSYGKSKQRSQRFYEIRSVDVSSDVLARHGLTNGAKQRLIALSLEMEKRRVSAPAICLVDRDLDHWFGPLQKNSHLRWCAFCSTEAHFFERSLVERLLADGFGAALADFDLFFESLSRVLRFLYVLRLADRDLDWRLRWVRLSKYVSLDNNALSFSEETYVSALLNTNNKIKNLAQFKTKCIEHDALLNGDHRLFIRGHDFVEVLAICARELGTTSGALATDEAIQKFFVLMARDCSTLALDLP